MSDKECYNHTKLELSLEQRKEVRSTDERKRLWHSNTRENDISGRKNSLKTIS